MYGPNGEGRGVVRYTQHAYSAALVFDGTTVYVSDSYGVTVYPIPLKAAGTRYTLGDEQSSWYTIMHRSNGELWSWNVGERKVQRWRME